MKSKIEMGVSKKDKARMIVLLVVLGLIITISYTTFTFVKKRDVENAKLAVVKGGNSVDVLNEYRDNFEYTPNFEDFFDVEDELDESVKYKVSQGEIKIRNYLGGKMYRAHPELIQKAAAPILHKTLVDDSNPNKGKVFWVIGKVISISSAPKITEILSAQFTFLYQIETADGGIFELQSIRSSQEIRAGDIVYMNGIYLKSKKSATDKMITPILLGNSIQILLPNPAIWETKEVYAQHLKELQKSNAEMIKLPNESELIVWSKKFEVDLQKNDETWMKIKDSKEEESQKLSPELESRMIAELSNVSNGVLLNLVDPKIKFDQLINENEKQRRKIIKIVGKVETVLLTILPEAINGVDKVYYAKVKDLRGNYYYYNFLSPQFFDQEDRVILLDAKEIIPKEGDIVVCTGVFVQLVKEEGAVTPLVYGKLMADLNEYDAIWDPVDHGGDRTAGTKFGQEGYLDAGQVEKAPLSYLFAKCSYTNSVAIEKSFFDTHPSDRIDFVKMMTKPEKYMDMPYVRFGILKKVTKVEGTVYYDFHGVKDVYEIYFIDEDRNLFSFVSLNLPPGAEMNKRMNFAGYFLKRTAFRNTDGNITWAPYLVGYISAVEVEKVKVMSPTEKIILIIITAFCLIFAGYINYKYFFPDKKVNKLRKESIENAKNNREKLRLLAEADKKMNEILITYFHHSLVEEMPVPVELCQSINHWPKSEEGKVHGLLRPEYLKSEYDALIRHYSEFKTEIPRDIKAAFFNKRKELLGLRTFQQSKFEIPDHEKKRGDCYLVVPLDYILKCPENLERMDDYLDEKGLPPWNTWMYIGKIPRFILKNSTTGYNPDTLVLVCFLPMWKVERAKAHYRVLIKEKRTKEEQASDDKEEVVSG